MDRVDAFDGPGERLRIRLLGELDRQYRQVHEVLDARLLPRGTLSEVGVRLVGVLSRERGHGHLGRLEALELDDGSKPRPDGIEPHRTAHVNIQGHLLKQPAPEAGG